MKICFLALLCCVLQYNDNTSCALSESGQVGKPVEGGKGALQRLFPTPVIAIIRGYVPCSAREVTKDEYDEAGKRGEELRGGMSLSSSSRFCLSHYTRFMCPDTCSNFKQTMEVYEPHTKKGFVRLLVPKYTRFEFRHFHHQDATSKALAKYYIQTTSKNNNAEKTQHWVYDLGAHRTARESLHAMKWNEHGVSFEE